MNFATAVKIDEALTAVIKLLTGESYVSKETDEDGDTIFVVREFEDG